MEILIYKFLFIVTFYFTIIRWITLLKIFEKNLNSFNNSLGLKDNYLTVIINWLMWFYQIYWWFSYFKII